MFSKKAARENYGDSRGKNAILYIVEHFTANDGDTARNNLNYFAVNITKTSAHYFVDTQEVCCSVPPEFVAYSVGAKQYKHPKCRNFNSISIEMCSRKDENGLYYIPEATQERAAKFTAQLMKEYSIPLSHVLRHYDITGKNCPEPFVRDPEQWEKFKKRVNFYLTGETEEQEMKYYEKLDEIPAGEMRDTVKNLVDRAIIKGSANGLHLSEDMVRMLVFLNRAGNFGK